MHREHRIPASHAGFPLGAESTCHLYLDLKSWEYVCCLRPVCDSSVWQPRPANSCVMWNLSVPSWITALVYALVNRESIPLQIYEGTCLNGDCECKDRLGGCLLLALLMAVYWPAPWREPSVDLLWGLTAVHSDTWTQDYMSAAILEIPGLLWILICFPPAGVVEHLRLFLEQPSRHSVWSSWVQGVSLSCCLVQYLQSAVFVWLYLKI